MNTLLVVGADGESAIVVAASFAAFWTSAVSLTASCATLLVVSFNVSAEYLDEAHRKRVGDMAWKVRFREGELADGSRPYILLLVEFQSTADRDMARRVREYTAMLLDRLIRNGVMAREGGLPRTLAVVVYNGGERWTAIGEESHLAEVPSELAERDLALLQPQFYRLMCRLR